jgi:hypothetical protein
LSRNGRANFLRRPDQVFFAIVRETSRVVCYELEKPRFQSAWLQNAMQEDQLKNHLKAARFFHTVSPFVGTCRHAPEKFQRAGCRFGCRFWAGKRRQKVCEKAIDLAFCVGICRLMPGYVARFFLASGASSQKKQNDSAVNRQKEESAAGYGLSFAFFKGKVVVTIMKDKILVVIALGLLACQCHAKQSGIFAAAASGDIGALQKYIAADPKAIATTNEAGRTPLCIAAMNGRTEAVHFLISRKADVNAKGFEDMTPLADLAADGTTNDDACSEVATVLVEHNADLSARDAAGETPLMRAVEARKSEMARVLIGHDASLTDKYKGANTGMTLLDMAVINHDQDMVKVLLEFSEPLNVMNKQGETPLQFAESRDETEIAAMLRAALPENQQDAVPPAREELRVIARRIAAGEAGAFDDLEKMAGKLYDGINVHEDRARLRLNLDRMNAAFKILGEEAGKGNDAALEALKKSLETKNLSGFAKSALRAAAKENAKAKTALDEYSAAHPSAN